MKFLSLPKLQKGDKVAILSPSFGAPAKFPDVYELGLSRLKEIFELEPVEFPTTKKLAASGDDRAKDLIKAFENPDIKAVFATIGGDDQITFVKNLPTEPFSRNPKPFFGYSDNTHFENFLWLQGIPSFYGGSIFTQFAMQDKMDDFTIKYLKYALFSDGEQEILSSPIYNDIELDWADPSNLQKKRTYELNEGLYWDATQDAVGISWGGCIESIDEILRHNGKLPFLNDFENIVLFIETSEEIPTINYVFRVLRALGERGILKKVKGVLVGRSKAWEFNNQKTEAEKLQYRKDQREIIIKAVRLYNKNTPIVQNLDFGHTDPQIAFPNGKKIKIHSISKKIFAEF